MQENINSLLYPGFIEELVDIVELKQDNLVVCSLCDIKYHLVLEIFTVCLIHFLLEAEDLRNSSTILEYDCNMKCVNKECVNTTFRLMQKKLHVRYF